MIDMNRNIIITVLVFSYLNLICQGNVVIGGTTSATVASPTSGSTAAQQMAQLTIASGDASINSLTIGKGGGQHFSNTAIGYQVLYENGTNDIENTVVGYQALKNNNGIRNSAFGFKAMSFNTAGGQNSAFGLYALYNNTSGGNNTAVGSYALWNNKTGPNNTGVGFSCLEKLTSGGYNVAVGWGALNQTTTGGYNTALGESALSSLTTGWRNIAIGPGANVPSPTSNYQLSIGNIIFGTGVDGTGNTISTGNIGIGTNSPAEKLQISGAVIISDGGYTGLTNNATAPVPAGGAGTMVFSNGNFFGWTGTEWKQLNN